MSLSNLSDLHFTAADISTIRSAVSTIESVLSSLSRNLSPEQRRKLGRVREQNKLFINKVRDYHVQQPALSSPDVDWNEFEADYQDRNFLEEVLNSLHALGELAGDAKILHDHDVYQAALTDYNYTKYKKTTDKGAYDAKFQAIRTFFPGAGTRGTETPPDTGAGADTES
ncbi:MAG: hypothetical protein ACT6QS_07290 [Flavobacteriales bacterium]